MPRHWRERSNTEMPSQCGWMRPDGLLLLFLCCEYAERVHTRLRAAYEISSRILYVLSIHRRRFIWWPHMATQLPPCCTRTCAHLPVSHFALISLTSMFKRYSALYVRMHANEKMAQRFNTTIEIRYMLIHSVNGWNRWYDNNRTIMRQSIFYYRFRYCF